jgi:hypothetical protein
MVKYKYECRPCPPHIRIQCIQEASISPASKRIIAQAFLSRTDTQDTWGLLQRNCLLVRREQIPRVAPTSQKGGIRERLHKKEEEAQEGEIAVVKPRPVQPETTQTRSQVPRKTTLSRPQTHTPGAEQPRSPRTEQVRSSRIEQARSPRHTTLSRQPAETRVLPPKPQVLRYSRALQPRPIPNENPGPRILVSQVIGHRILLPMNGELVLGRFDSSIQNKPDIDLTFEDRITKGISRRHAKITSWRGRYAIEDLGSSYGTWVNDTKLALQEKHVLSIGDKVRLGNCLLFFDLTPAYWETPFLVNHRFLYATFTGRYFGLPQKNSVIIGRADADLNFVPVQKTRTDGQPVSLGTQVPLFPGQHLWLGGYTVAFDIVESS